MGLNYLFAGLVPRPFSFAPLSDVTAHIDRAETRLICLRIKCLCHFLSKIVYLVNNTSKKPVILAS